MHSFKLVLKLLKSHKGPLLIIFSVFMGISILMSILNSSEEGDEFLATSLKIGIVDEGNGTIAGFLEKYFKEEHTLQSISYDEKNIVNELYWKSLDYVLLIPEGADEILQSNEKELKLQCMKVPGHSANGLFETELRMALSKLNGLLQAGFSMEEATNQLLDVKEEKTEVIMAMKVNEKNHDRLSRYLIYIPYFFIAFCIEGVGFILLIMNQKNVKERMECGATNMNQRTFGMVLGILFLGAFIYIVAFTVAAILSGGSLFTDSRMPFFLLNCFVLLLFSLSLGFLVGVIAKSPISLNGYQNVLGLSLCFLGGVFVPQEVLGETALKVGRFLPTYWYIRSTENIASMVTVSDEFLKEFAKNSAVILLYAIAVFSFSYLLQSLKRKNLAAD